VATPADRSALLHKFTSSQAATVLSEHAGDLASWRSGEYLDDASCPRDALGREDYTRIQHVAHALIWGDFLICA